MTGNPYLDVKPEVAEALAAGKPVVALESTIISHGMPYPQNVETALNVENIIRECGAVPATIAIIGGRLKAGLTAEEIAYFGKKGRAIAKASRRDIAAICARGEDGATTVTTTMMIAHMAGISFFATGGIGGVHRGAETTMDISADLEELANTPVTVVCAGAKAILDLKLTLEYLETHGVPVIGYGTEELPAFYSRHSGLKVDYRMDTPAEIAATFRAQDISEAHETLLGLMNWDFDLAMREKYVNGALMDNYADIGEAQVLYAVPGIDRTVPVYVYPDTKAPRAAKGKASVSLKEPVAFLCREGDWLMVLYETGEGKHRTGWVSMQDDPVLKRIGEVSLVPHFTRDTVMVKKKTELVDDPLNIAGKLCSLKKGSRVRVLAREAPLFYVEAEVGGKTYRGYVESSCLEGN